MSTATDVVRRLFDDVLNRREPAALERLVAEDYVEQNAYPGQPAGRAGVAARIALLLTAFPDAQFVLEDTIVADEKVVARWNMRGTQRGEFLGIVPTGKRVLLQGIDIYVVRGGQIQTHWNQLDLLGAAQQLGASLTPPPPAQP